MKLRAFHYPTVVIGDANAVFLQAWVNETHTDGPFQLKLLLLKWLSKWQTSCTQRM